MLFRSKAESFKNGDMTVSDIGFILQNTTCGDKKETHTVKDWLEHFNIPIKDEYYIKWNKFIMLFGGYMRDNEKVLSEERKGDLYNIARVAMYFAYDTEKDFREQFEDNVRYVLKQIGKEW